MKIELKKWQANLLTDVFEQIPIHPKTVLEQQITLITYGDHSIGNGTYKNGRVEISSAIRHPRMLVERALHECGHGIEEWLAANNFSLFDCNIEQIADGFAIALLYPSILEEQGLYKIRKIYSESLFMEGFPDIDTETIIAKYVRNSEELMQQSHSQHGARVSSALLNLFEQQRDGFLRRHSAAFSNCHPEPSSR